MSNVSLVLLLCSCISLKAFSQTSWEIDKCKDEIVVYTRLEKDSDFKSFKAVMTVTPSSVEIIEILKDANAYTKWYGYTKTSELLLQEKGVQYNYVETEFPWPYSNRDMVYRMSIDDSNPKAVVISLEGIPDYVLEKKGIVRMKKATGFIVLKSVAEKTEITYQFHSEPGDGIPTWLANRSIAELPYKTLSGLRKMLQERN